VTVAVCVDTVVDEVGAPLGTVAKLDVGGQDTTEEDRGRRRVSKAVCVDMWARETWRLTCR
jgi:hypothetical protein